MSSWRRAWASLHTRIILNNTALMLMLASICYRKASFQACAGYCQNSNVIYPMPYPWQSCSTSFATSHSFLFSFTQHVEKNANETFLNPGSLKVCLPLHDIFSYFEKTAMRKISNYSLVIWKQSPNLDLIFTESLMLLFTKGTCLAKYIKQLCSIKSFSKKIKRIQCICMRTDNLISMLKRLISLSGL